MNQKTIIAILSVIIVILLGVTVYFLMMKQNDQSTATQQGKIGNTLENYTNDKIGVSLNYPKNYTLDEPTPNGDVVIIKQNDKKEYLQIQLSKTTPPPLEIYRPNGSDYVEDVSIDSKNARKYFTDNPIGEGVLEGYSFTSYFILVGDKKWIEIRYYGDNKVFEDIIDSIKFN